MRKPGAGEKDAGEGPEHPQPSTTPIEDHVQEHGPAHTIHHHFDQDGTKMHHVSTYHGDATPDQQDHPGAHHSQHKTHSEAHEHMGKAMELHSTDESEERETPDEEEAEEALAQGGKGSTKIPGLA